MLRKSALWISAVGVVTLFGLGAASVGGSGGYLGVTLDPAPSGDVPGAVVRDVVPDGPAEKAGLRSGDRIVSVGDRKIGGYEDLRKALEDHADGSNVDLSVRRGDEEVRVNVTLGRRETVAPRSEEPEELEDVEELAFLGVGVDPVHIAVAAHLRLGEGEGVVLRDIMEGSAAQKAGLQENDIVVAVDGRAVGGPEAFVMALKSKKPGDEVKLDVIHRGTKASVKATLGKRPADLPSLKLFPERPWAVDPFRRFPRHGRKGRIILRDPDGSERLFQLPDGAWNVDDFMKDFMEQMHKDLPDWPGADRHQDLSRRIRKLFESFHGDSSEDPEGALPEGVEISRSSSHTSVSRLVEGGYDVTVREVDGERTVDVKKGDEVIAEGLPWDRVKTLPEEARQIVERAARPIRSGKEPQPARPLRRLPKPTDSGPKA